MDVSDQGSVREEEERERALALRRTEGPRPTGLCLFCGLVLTSGKRWCDAECRDEWQHWCNHAKQTQPKR